MKSPGGGKALLFEKPTIDGKASTFPVAINTMGSRRRMAMALQVNSVEDLAQEIRVQGPGHPDRDRREDERGQLDARDPDAEAAGTLLVIADGQQLRDPGGVG